MAGLFDTMKSNLTPVSLTGGPPTTGAIIPPASVFAPRPSGDDRDGDIGLSDTGPGQMKLTPATASKSAASVIR